MPQPAKQFFFAVALDAARTGAEAFREAFKLPEADANADSYSLDGVLIHALIRMISDSQLPPLLQVLIDNKVDLEVKSLVGTPVFYAVLHQKKETTRFLILNKAITHDEKKSLLVRAIPLSMPKEPEAVKCVMDIIKMLVEEFSVPIDSKDQHGCTALHCAAENSYLFIIHYLLEHGAKILAYPLAAAYHKMTTRSDFLSPGYEENINACLKLLFDTAYAHFFYLVYDTGMSEESLKKYYFDKFLTEACQQFPYDCQAAEKQNLIAYLEKNLRDKVIRDVPIAKRELQERRAFCMGLATPKKPANVNSIYSFSRHKLFDKNIVRKIFSYAQEFPSVPKRSVFKNI